MIKTLNPFRLQSVNHTLLVQHLLYSQVPLIRCQCKCKLGMDSTDFFFLLKPITNNYQLLMAYTNKATDVFTIL